jgi:ferritin-like metal-binding protein YciE
MKSLENLSDLFIRELRDLHDAEQQLLTALPLLAQAAKAETLRRGFEHHLNETKTQLGRLQKIFKGLGKSPEGKTCQGMAGLIAEAKEALDHDAAPEVLDEALIVAAQKVEHYEIAGYGSVSTFARVLDYPDAARLLKQTIAEEERMDQHLTRLSEQLNVKAATADQAAT